MDEAEVYGNGLERGRAMNLYVDNRLHKQINLISQGPENSTRSIGDTVQLVCLVVPRTTRTLWLKGILSLHSHTVFGMLYTISRIDCAFVSSIFENRLY